jgi:hypothetical protein
MKLLRENLNEEIDSRYLEIKFTNIKKELDFIVELFNQGRKEKAREYIEDQIQNLKGILGRL